MVWPTLSAVLKLKALRAMWGPLIVHNRLTVVVSTHPGPHSRSTARVSLNEMTAFVALSEAVKGLGCAVAVVDGKCRLGDVIDDDLVLMGGPAANDITAEVWQRIESRLPFSFDLDRMTLSVSGRTYVPKEDQTGQLVRDYALLIRVSDSLASNRRVLLCSGCHGYGTLGAVVASIDRAFIGRLSKNLSNGQDFCALLEVEIQQRAISPPQLREIFILA